MARVEIDILNKQYNSRERRAFDSFNLKMRKKREKRIAKSDKKPLSEHEKFLYEAHKLDEVRATPCSGFYKCNGVSHVLFNISNTHLENFYEETRLLNAKFPSKNYFGSAIMDEFTKNSFLTLAGPNRIGIQHVSEIEPTDKKINQFVKTILITAFSISYDTVCIDFQLFYNEPFLEQFNKMLTDDFDTELEYKKIFSSGQYVTTYNIPLAELSRKQYADDVLFEIKSRVVEFLKNNYEFLKKYKETPFSVDEYRTNLKRDDRYIGSYGYVSFSDRDLFQFTYSENKTGFVLLDYRESIKHPFYDLKRGRILFIINDDERVYIQETLDFILMFYLQKNEINNYKEILNKKYALFEKIGMNEYLCISKIFREYSNLCLQTNNSQTLLDFEKSNVLPYVNQNSYLENLLSFLKNETLKLSVRNKELDEKINNILSSKNNSAASRTAAFALFISALSAVAAIITLLLTIFKHS